MSYLWSTQQTALFTASVVSYFRKTQLKLRVYTYILIVKLNAQTYVYFKPRALENILSQKNLCLW